MCAVVRQIYTNCQENADDNCPPKRILFGGPLASWNKTKWEHPDELTNGPETKKPLAVISAWN